MGRKRRRSRAFPADDADDADSAAIIDQDQSPQDQDGKSQLDEEELTEDRKKELDVWESFKEEHHEVLEQLPLSLHRQFKLMRELDTQNDALHAEILSSVRRYVDLRKSLAPLNSQEVIAQRTVGSSSMPMDVDQIDADQAGHASPSGMPVHSIEPAQTETVNGNARSTSSTPSFGHTPGMASFQAKPGETTCILLQHISQTSEEAIRSAEEKVSIAQTAYETVDRHIRLLDQAIKEQQAAISLGMRPGTHLAPILLPDLVVPRWARPSRVEHSPIIPLSPELDSFLTDEPPVLELPEPQAPTRKKKGKKAAPQKATKPQKGELEEPITPAPVQVQELLETPRTRRSGVRLTLPVQPQPPGPTVPADPNEARYCYCNQVSFGTMIGCDNEACKLEWFHLGCTGLSEVPNKKTKWYCRECKPKMMQRGRPRS
ncbi:hypothetical protein BU15DRAFT_46599 [Melanogaster broomeanus]|nr:hypothetical protein BU15DRAFT_46599 [Melanogaster broomeanus]